MLPGAGGGPLAPREGPRNGSATPDAKQLAKPPPHQPRAAKVAPPEREPARPDEREKGDVEDEPDAGGRESTEGDRRGHERGQRETDDRERRAREWPCRPLERVELDEKRDQHEQRRRRQCESQSLEPEHARRAPRERSLDRERSGCDEGEPPRAGGDEGEREGDPDADRCDDPGAERDDEPAEVGSHVLGVRAAEHRLDELAPGDRKRAGRTSDDREGEPRGRDDVAHDLGRVDAGA